MIGIWQRIPVPESHVAGLLGGLVLDRLIRRRLPTALVVLGRALTVGGVALNAVAVWAHSGGDLSRPERLVATGIYRWTRNPMYVGWSMLHLGVAMVLRSPGMLVTWPPAAVVVHRGVLAEESLLQDRFGEEYRAYADAVPRYLFS